MPFDTYLLRALTLARASISSLATRVSECECAVRWSSVNLGLSSSVESTTTLTEAPRSISARTRNGRSFCTALMRQSSRVATLAAAHMAHIPNRESTRVPVADEREAALTESTDVRQREIRERISLLRARSAAVAPYAGSRNRCAMSELGLMTECTFR